MDKKNKHITDSKVKWKNDDELFSIVREELYSAVVGDIMDKLGYTHQFLSPHIQPLHADMFIVGRAMTVLEADVFEDSPTESVNPGMTKPFGFMLEALDDLKKNEVYVCTGSSPSYALWGELMSTAAMRLGAAGAVVDGYSRDTKGIIELNFPTFAYGSYAQDQAHRGKVIDFRVPIEIENVRILPGDIIIGDIDGVCVVPKAIEDEVFNGAIKKARGEKTVQKAIQAGMSAKEAFETFGIL